MSYELNFEDVLFESATDYVEGDLCIEVEPILEEASIDPYGAIPKAGYDVVGFKVVSGSLYYMGYPSEVEEEISVNHDQVLSIINGDLILERLQQIYGGKDDCVFC